MNWCRAAVTTRWATDGSDGAMEAWRDRMVAKLEYYENYNRISSFLVTRTAAPDHRRPEAPPDHHKGIFSVRSSASQAPTAQSFQELTVSAGWIRGRHGTKAPVVYRVGGRLPPALSSRATPAPASWSIPWIISSTRKTGLFRRWNRWGGEASCLGDGLFCWPQGRIPFSSGRGQTIRTIPRRSSGRPKRALGPRHLEDRFRRHGVDARGRVGHLLLQSSDDGALIESLRAACMRSALSLASCPCSS